jgi:type IV secretion system protein VirB8
MPKADSGFVTYYQDGQRWEEDISRRDRRSRAVAWLIAMILGVVAVCSLVVLAMLMPLKTFEPYFVEVDKTTGYMEVTSGLTRTTTLTEQQAVTQANVVRYIRAREKYDPYAVSENFGLAQLLSTGRASDDLTRLYSNTNPNNPTKVYGTNRTVAVEIKSVTFPNTSTALVRFSTTETGPAQLTVKHFISVVRFRYTDTPLRMEWRFDNPLGFQVYEYQRDQETVTAGSQ